MVVIKYCPEKIVGIIKSIAINVTLNLNLTPRLLLQAY
jgi:hypothetical protein